MDEYDEYDVSQDNATAALYTFIVEYLDSDQLEALAFEIGIDPSELDGSLVEELADSLIRRVARRDETQALDLALRDLFPVQYGREFADDLEADADVVQQPPPDPDGYIHKQTGIGLIHITGGPFPYGDEPTDEIELKGFDIGRTPVTNRQYKRFLDANPDYPVPFVDEEWADGFNWDRDLRMYPLDKMDHPVVLVSWEDALAFCRWAGLRLPTEKEWEKTARGVDARLYPWGNLDPDTNWANYGRDVGDTSAVDAYPLAHNASPYGAADMAGNVWEWTATWYDLGVEDDRVHERVVRGGAWDSDELELQTFFRTSRDPGTRAPNLGFRVAK